MQYTDLSQNFAGVRAFCTHAGFNICTYTGAEACDLRPLEELTGLSRDCMVWPVQTHTANVAVVGAPCHLPNTDALVTRRRRLLIGVNTADCVPLLMADTRAGVIAACHCGWRGTVAGIAATTLRTMTDLGARPGHIRAVIGPCICPGCFEVGTEVAALFPPEAVIETPGARPHVDLPRAVALQLPGVDVSFSGLCSMTDSRFYSVRRQGRGELRRTFSAIFMP